MNYKELSTCVACGSNILVSVLDLGKQPLANSFKLEKEEFQEEYPLAINRCDSCYHVQLTHSVNPKLLFDDYLYVSGTTKTGHAHFESFSLFVDKQSKGKSILDIGCNDGTQLDYFKKLGYKTFGVDPAKNLHTLSNKNHCVYRSYFDDDFTNSMQNAEVKYDVITAQNVFAHTADPLQFLLNAKKLMHDETILFIQTSQANMILNNEFDTIYHEHVSFFNINSMKKLCERANLCLIDVNLMPIHGTSFVFSITKNGNTEKINSLIEEENSQGLYSPETYVNYKNSCNDIVKTLKYECDYVRQNMIGWNVVGYGAPAKGMTLLNYSKLNLDFIIDDNILKQGRFTPGSSIPIYGPEKLEELTDTTLFVPLAWNFFDEIRNRIKERRNNKHDRFITYFPKVEMVE